MTASWEQTLAKDRYWLTFIKNIIESWPYCATSVTCEGCIHRHKQISKISQNRKKIIKQGMTTMAMTTLTTTTIDGNIAVRAQRCWKQHRGGHLPHVITLFLAPNHEVDCWAMTRSPTLFWIQDDAGGEGRHLFHFQSWSQEPGAESTGPWWMGWVRFPSLAAAAAPHLPSLPSSLAMPPSPDPQTAINNLLKKVEINNVLAPNVPEMDSVSSGVKKTKTTFLLNKKSCVSLTPEKQSLAMC